MLRNSRTKFFMACACIGIMIAGMSACSRKKDVQENMDQLHKQNGYPVKIQEISEASFSNSLTFFATLRGYEESTKGSMVGDRILRIHAKVGQAVSAGSVIVEFPLNNPSLQITQAKASLDNSKKMLDRLQNLLKAGETTQQNVDNAMTQYEVNKRNYESLQQLITVEAPISGIITEMKYKEGDFVRAGDPLFTVAKLNKMIAQIWASETEAMQVRNGMPATVKVGDRIYHGHVSMVSLAMDESKRAFDVEVMLDNGNRELKSGVTVEVTIAVSNKKNTISINRDLLQWDGSNYYVYLEQGGKAIKRVVKKGAESDLKIEIVSGLNLGDHLITEGQSMITDGSKLNIVK